MKFAASKRGFFVICWITYVCAYLCRVNLSSVLPKLGDGLGVDSVQLGLLGSLFFASYAVGQLVNGFVGDRVPPYLYVSVAIAGTALLNLTISWSSRYGVVLVCWCLNGVFQSMIWGPLMRLLSQRFSPDETVNVSTGMHSSIVVGFILTWSVLGQLLADSPWESYFLIPAFTALAILPVWLVLLKKGGRGVQEPYRVPDFKGLWGTLRRERLWVAALLCVCLGLVKESVSLWAPTILTKVLGMDAKGSLWLLLVIPLANMGGLFLTRALSLRLAGRPWLVARLLFLTVAAASAVLLAVGVSPAAVLLLAVVSAMANGCNSILLSQIPLSYASEGIVSTLVGIFDFCSYMGAAVSSFLLGKILANAGWSAALVIWLGTALAGAALSLLISYLRKVDIRGREKQLAGN